MKRVHVYLREDQYETLREKAYITRTSITDIVRRAVDEVINQKEPSSARPTTVQA